MLVKELPSEERPREKALMYGINTLSNRELLAIIIRNGTKNCSSLQIADIILKKANGIKGLNSLTIDDLIAIKGINKVKGLEILVIFELIKRILYREVVEIDIFDSPNKIVEWLKLKIGHYSQEVFIVIYLNVKLHIIDYSIIFKGAINASIVDIRQVYKEAMKKSASNIIVAHNHPSGDITPSSADKELTDKLIEVGKLVDIELKDHLIITNNDYYSFAINNLIN